MDLTEQNKAEIHLVAREVVKEYALNLKEVSEKLTSEIKDLPNVISIQIQKDLKLIEVKFDARINANSGRIDSIEKRGYARKTDLYKVGGMFFAFGTFMLYMFERFGQ